MTSTNESILPFSGEPPPMEMRLEEIPEDSANVTQRAQDLVEANLQRERERDLVEPTLSAVIEYPTPLRPSRVAPPIVGLTHIDIGSLSWRRRNRAPIIWFPGNGGPRWVAVKDLTGRQFEIVRASLVDGIKKLQSRARSNWNTSNQPVMIHLPSPDERRFLQQIFNNHLTDAEKRRYITEFKHTIIGSSTCSVCLHFNNNSSLLCLHPDCPGMCEECFEKMANTCPSCNKEQVLKCPICREDKKPPELAKSQGGCHHYVCYACMGKAYNIGNPIKKCPLCRGSWLAHH